MRDITDSGALSYAHILRKMSSLGCFPALPVPILSRLPRLGVEDLKVLHTDDFCCTGVVKTSARDHFFGQLNRKRNIASADAAAMLALAALGSKEQVSLGKAELNNFFHSEPSSSFQAPAVLKKSPQKRKRAVKLTLSTSNQVQDYN